jgi:hypothetical protein
MKKNPLYILVSILELGIFSPALYGSSSIFIDDSTIALDEIIELEKGFDNRSLKKVGTLRASKTTLETKFLEELVQSKCFKKVHTLELSNQQNLTNQHIIDLANNPVFSRLSCIHLSNCPQIGDEAIMAILNSKYIGSIRESPKGCGRYGCHSTTVWVSVNGTAVTKELRRKTLENHSFTVIYRPSNTQRYFSNDYDAVKIIEFSY